MTTEPILEISGLQKYYQESSGFLSSLFGGESYIRAVDGVDLEIMPGEVYGLVGESGSGKSTIGETVLRLEEPTGGSITFKGENVGDYSRKELREFRQDAQIVFQDPYGSVNPKKTVFKTVAEPLKNFGVTEEDVESRVAEMLHDVGLRPPEDFLHAYPDHLSGGQRQRVNIARALVLEPDLLVADEPMSMLDVSIQSGIMKILRRLQDELDFAMLYISHDLSVVRLIADRVGVLYRGKLVESGTAEQVIRDPQHPYTQALMSSLPDLSKKRERVLLEESMDGQPEDGEVTGCNFHPRCPNREEICSQEEPALCEAGDRPVRCYLHHNQAEDGRTVDVGVELKDAGPVGNTLHENKSTKAPNTD